MLGNVGLTFTEHEKDNTFHVSRREKYGKLPFTKISCISLSCETESKLPSKPSTVFALVMVGARDFGYYVYYTMTSKHKCLVCAFVVTSCKRIVSLEHLSWALVINGSPCLLSTPSTFQSHLFAKTHEI